MIRIKETVNADKNLIRHIAESLNVSERLSSLLIDRGVDSVESARKFLNPNLSDLHNPYLFKGMKDAVERIKIAKENGETVVIYGDYDADGISAVTVLYRSLQIFGIDAIPVIPERQNGYGLSQEMLSFVLEQYFPDLIITVDCGISAVKEVEELKDLGVDVIVTDHHEIPEQIPDCTVINCKLTDGGYPFDGLCGAGVAYKLATALIGKRADEFIDVVAVATIADSMPLIDENRIIVSEGLKKIKSGRAVKAIKAIANVSGLKEVNSSTVAYTIAPRINAAGRMDDARSALQAFISDDIQEIESLAKLLNEYNAKRQAECDMLYRSAKSMIDGKSPDNRVIALYNTEWKAGLIGIVSARLVEEYSKPVILFSEREGVLHGSARSVSGVNIFKALSAVKGHVEDYGGHAQAAGVTLKKEKFEIFEKELNEYLTENCTVSDLIQETEVEELITDKFSLSFAKELALLEPFGVGNKKPLFAVECQRAFATPLKLGSNHLSFKHEFIELLMFNGMEKLTLLNSEIKKTIVFEPNVSVFNGRESLKGYIREISSVICNESGVLYAVCLNQLGSLSEKGSYTKIDDKQAELMLENAEKEIYGTLFIVNDYETLNKFKKTNRFGKGVLSPNGKGNVNAVIYGTDGRIPDGYKKIVYLDKPLSVIETDREVYVNEQTNGFTVDKISAEREVLGKIYLAVKNLPQGFVSVEEIIKITCLSARHIAFAVSVFIELGLIIAQGGRYKAVSGIKRDLADSSVYKSIKSILG